MPRNPRNRTRIGPEGEGRRLGEGEKVPMIVKAFEQSL